MYGGSVGLWRAGGEAGRGGEGREDGEAGGEGVGERRRGGERLRSGIAVCVSVEWMCDGRSCWLLPVRDVLDVGCWMLDVGCWMLDANC